MELTEIKEVCRKEEVTIGYQCDCCGKIIKGDELPDSWHEFSAKHYDYDGAGIDSFTSYMVCSPDCYFKTLSKALEEFKDYDTAEIENFKIDFAKTLITFLNKD